MKKEWVLTQDAFDELLDWLDPDRERAAEKYETIRLQLIKILTCRGCRQAEDFADEAINRVLAKISDLRHTYTGNPALYFYGVVNKVHLEYVRKTESRQTELADWYNGEDRAVSPLENEDVEAEYQCLENCLDELPANNRLLVVRYYQEEKGAKIVSRKRLAEEFGLGVNALRIRAHRIRLALQECVQHCLKEQPAN